MLVKTSSYVVTSRTVGSWTKELIHIYIQKGGQTEGREKKKQQGGQKKGLFMYVKLLCIVEGRERLGFAQPARVRLCLGRYK